MKFRTVLMILQNQSKTTGFKQYLGEVKEPIYLGKYVGGSKPIGGSTPKR